MVNTVLVLFNGLTAADGECRAAEGKFGLTENEGNKGIRSGRKP